jgi:hypothetical protein
MEIKGNLYKGKNWTPMAEYGPIVVGRPVV